MCDLRRRVVAVGGVPAIGLAMLLLQPSAAAETQKLVGLHEPVFRVLKEVNKSHPLDPPLKTAHASLAHMQAQLKDYTCYIIKRERIGRKLGASQLMFAKIRNQQQQDGRVTVPFSVYLKFVKPPAIKGREVIYVAGRNNGNLIAHEGGWKGRVTPAISLKPGGALAMMGQRYPITDIGIENLCVRLIETGARDKKLGDCVVEMHPAKIRQRPCTRIQVKHPQRLPQLSFHLARIFVDGEYKVPVRYEAYDWPSGADGNLTVQDDLIEEYTYVQLKFNVGLTDKDFDPANSSYKMK